MAHTTARPSDGKKDEVMKATPKRTPRMRHILRGTRRAFRSGASRAAAGAVVAVVIFGLGVNVGNGTITLPWNHSQTGLPSKLDYSSVNQVYQVLRSQYDGKLTETQLLNGIKSGMVNAVGDQYTEYFTPSQAAQFNDQLQGTFSGIGAQLGESSSNQLEIIAPLDGSPASKAGLKAQDLITSINGKSTSGVSADDAANIIRGAAGTKVTLGITRGSSQLSFTITRANITVPSVTWSIIDGNIGYMQISQFSSDTASLAEKAAAQFQAKNVKGVVLDMRDNPGGLLDAAVDVSSLWLPNGQTILQEKRGNTVVDTYTSNGDDVLHGIPTVVLVDGGTASAAEITAGALHDNHAATLVGVKTYGKGVVQQVTNLSGGAEMKVTVASWYRPDGQNINKKGITPDKIVTISDADVASGSDPQKAEALAILQGQ